jgi:hypothetical protein
VEVAEVTCSGFVLEEVTGFVPEEVTCSGFVLGVVTC